MSIGVIIPTLLIAALVSVTTPAVDVAGKWRAEFATADGQTVQNVFTFQQDGEKLTGTVYSSLSGTDAKIEEGSIKGETLAFAITRTFGGNDIRLRYSGQVKGDEIQMTVTAGEGADGFKIDITAKREKS